MGLVTTLEGFSLWPQAAEVETQPQMRARTTGTQGGHRKSRAALGGRGAHRGQGMPLGEHSLQPRRCGSWISRGATRGFASRADRLPQCSWSAWRGAAGTHGTSDMQGPTVTCFAFSQQSSPPGTVSGQVLVPPSLALCQLTPHCSWPLVGSLPSTSSEAKAGDQEMGKRAGLFSVWETWPGC